MSVEDPGCAELNEQTELDEYPSHSCADRPISPLGACPRGQVMTGQIGLLWRRGQGAIAEWLPPREELSLACMISATLAIGTGR